MKKYLAAFIFCLTVLLLGACDDGVTKPNPDDTKKPVNPGDGTRAYPFPLTENVWRDGSILIFNDAKYYSFNVTAGTTYYIWFNSGRSGGGDGTKTLTGNVSVIYYEGNSNVYSGPGRISGWTTPQPFKAPSDGEIVVDVNTGFLKDSGTYAIAYSTSAVRPGLYAVTYNLNGGNGTTPTSQTGNSATSVTLANGTGLSRSGYLFGGWNTSSDGTGTNYNVGSSYKPTGNITLYARWIAPTVTYDLNGGTGTTPPPQTGTPVTLAAGTGFSRDGYAFDGWLDYTTGTNYNAGSSFTLTVANITLYAVWSNQFTVIYDANGGSGEMATSGFPVGESQNLRPNTFTNTGYTFAGWAISSTGTAVYTDGQSVSLSSAKATVTLYAVWIGNTYTVFYNANGGDGVMEPSGFTYGVEQPLRVNTFTRSKYGFIGWAFSPTGEGTPIENVVYANGQSVKNLTPVDGGTVILYAVWAPVYTVVYNNSGGIGVMEPSEFAYGVEQALRPNTFTHTNYGFAGWDINETATDVFFNDGQIVSNLTLGEMITLYAVWTPGYTVVYNANGGSGETESSIHAFDVAKPLNANTFTRTGYFFNGWATTSTGTAVYADGQSVRNLASTTGATVTLYAVWHPGFSVPGSSLIAKLAWLQTNAQSNTNYLVEVNADESIDPAVLSYSGKTNVNITLIGTGAVRTVSLSSNGILFRVESGVTLTLGNNITLQGHSDNNSVLVYVNSDGTLVMNLGSRITGNTNYHFSSSSTGIASATSNGGGVYVNRGTFTMNGGEISGNTAYATATQTGTAASEYSSASSSGGGVYLNNGTFTMNGGKISGNASISSVESTPDSGNDARAYIWGGGMYVSGSNGSFTMNGGEITGNTNTPTATGANASTSSWGSGVYHGGGSTLRIVTGTISGNTGSTSEFSGTFEYGTFSDGTWIRNGSLSYASNIRVVNGVLQ